MSWGDVMTKVSVIIPVYNNERFIETCIESVRRQTLREIEIILINDGSTDKSGEIMKKLAEKDARIKLFSQENMGVAVARNKGIENAGGEYLTFVDGDDYIASDYLEVLYDCAQKKDADMVICGITFVDTRGKVLKKIVPGEYVRFQKEEWVFRISAVCSHFYRREMWYQYGIKFQEGERGEDMPVSLFFSAMCSKIYLLSISGYYYVQHSSSAVHSFRGLRKYRLPYIALEEMIKKIESLGVVNSLEFYELFVLRILCTCYFELARGASKEKLNELCDYIIHILETYFPDYAKNRYVKLSNHIEVPFSQKAAVWLLVHLVKTKSVYLFANLLRI